MTLHQGTPSLALTLPRANPTCRLQNEGATSETDKYYRWRVPSTPSDAAASQSQSPSLLTCNCPRPLPSRSPRRSSAYSSEPASSFCRPRRRRFPVWSSSLTTFESPSAALLSPFEFRVVLLGEVHPAQHQEVRELELLPPLLRGLVLRRPLFLVENALAQRRAELERAVHDPLANDDPPVGSRIRPRPPPSALPLQVTRVHLLFSRAVLKCTEALLGLVQVPLAASSTPAGRTFCSNTNTSPLLAPPPVLLFPPDSQPPATLDSRHSRRRGRSRGQRSQGASEGGRREWRSRSSDGADPDDGRGVAAGGQLVGRGGQKPNHGDHHAEVENTGRFRRGTPGKRLLFSLGWRSP